MTTSTPKMLRLAGGFAVGLGLGTLALAVTAFNHPGVPADFAGATALIGLFCMAIGRVCLMDRDAEAAAMAAKTADA